MLASLEEYIQQHTAIPPRCAVYAIGRFSGLLNLYTPASVNEVIAQANGENLVGGTFAGFSGVRRNNLVRLNSDFSVDEEFAPEFDHEVYSIALKSDGSILAGGRFSYSHGCHL